MDDVEAVVRTMNQIRKYLNQHPEAADTVAGVRCWLQTFGGGHEKPEVVQRALDLLVAGGEITCEPLPGGKGYYRRQRARGEEQ